MPELLSKFFNKANLVQNCKYKYSGTSLGGETKTVSKVQRAIVHMLLLQVGKKYPSYLRGFSQVL